MVIPAQFLNQNFHEIFVYHFLKMESKEYSPAQLAGFLKLILRPHHKIEYTNLYLYDKVQ
ncbi:MAG: hypothetical protein NEHIOOID_00888 [Holosporales bacterium]